MKTTREPITYHVAIMDMEEKENPSRRIISLEAHSDDGTLRMSCQYFAASPLAIRRDLRRCFETFGVPPYVPLRCLSFELSSRYYGMDQEGRWIQDIQLLLGEELTKPNRISVMQASVCPKHLLRLRVDITTKAGLRSAKNPFNIHFTDVLEDVTDNTWKLYYRVIELKRSKERHDSARRQIRKNT